MSMNKTLIALGCFLLLITACKPDTEKLLCKKWKTIDVDNSTSRKQEIYYKEFLDTVTVKNELMQFFPSLDSLKIGIRAEREELRNAQKENIENSFLEFKKNNVVYFTSIEGEVPSKWKLEGKEIVVEDDGMERPNQITRLKIMEIGSENLVLRMVDANDTSVIKLKAVKK